MRGRILTFILHTLLFAASLFISHFYFIFYLKKGFEDAQAVTAWIFIFSMINAGITVPLYERFKKKIATLILRILIQILLALAITFLTFVLMVTLLGPWILSFGLSPVIYFAPGVFFGLSVVEIIADKRKFVVGFQAVMIATIFAAVSWYLIYDLPSVVILGRFVTCPNSAPNVNALTGEEVDSVKKIFPDRCVHFYTARNLSKFNVPKTVLIYSSPPAQNIKFPVAKSGMLVHFENDGVWQNKVIEGRTSADSPLEIGPSPYNLDNLYISYKGLRGEL